MFLFLFERLLNSITDLINSNTKIVFVKFEINKNKSIPQISSIVGHYVISFHFELKIK